MLWVYIRQKRGMNRTCRQYAGRKAEEGCRHDAQRKKTTGEILKDMDGKTQAYFDYHAGLAGVKTTSTSQRVIESLDGVIERFFRPNCIK